MNQIMQKSRWIKKLFGIIQLLNNKNTVSKRLLFREIVTKKELLTSVLIVKISIFPFIKGYFNLA
ncbi:MAG: hypothetical protein KKA19_06830 [Candidatus Margulisbacteria bacterium]|nr:hypothetical protein [Candidatus Margulisiibacteriota bacterium]